MPDLVINLTAPPVIRETIDQTGHGFVVGNVVRADAVANTYVKALADNEANSMAVGIVSQVVNANQFVVTYQGRILSGIPAVAAGTIMYLSDSVAGALTSTAPAIEVPILVVSQNAVSGIVINSLQRGGGGAGTVQSVTGLNTDNTDPANPVVQISVDGTTISGAGTPGSPLATVGPGGSASSMGNGYNSAQITGASTEYLSAHDGPVSASIALADSERPIQISGTIDRFSIQSTSAQPADDDIVFTLFKNGIATSLVVTIAANDPAGVYIDTINSVSVAIGDLLAVRAVNSSSSSSATLIGSEFRVTTVGANPGAIDFETDGTPNSDQSLLNLVAGTGISLSETAGAVTIDSTVTPSVPIVSLTRAALQALIAGSTLDTTVTYRVTDAVGSTIVVDAWAATNNTLHAAMIDQTNTRFGFYNIVGDAFTEVYEPAFTVLPLASGGTNKNMTAVNGGVVWSDADSLEVTAAGTSGQPLLSAGAAAPTWGTASTGPTDFTVGAAVVGFSSLTTNIVWYNYNPQTKLCTVSFLFNGTSDNIALTFTAPFTSAAIDQNIACVLNTNNGVASTTIGRLRILASQTTVDVGRDRNLAAWTASGTKVAFGTFSYFTA